MRKFFSIVICLSVLLFSAAALSSCGDDDNDEKGTDGSGKGAAVHEMVDLGLPSGLLWATCNVGASTPYEDGSYFAWGETTPKSDYDWDTYKWCDGSKNTLTKYCDSSACGKDGFADGKAVLDAEDDAATANWGADYRMPTYEEFSELCDNCEWAWDDDHNGYTVTGKNGKSIFLPASGFRYGDILNDHGSVGNYWDATVRSVYANDASYLDFGSSKYTTHYYDDRCLGHTVRPVAAS